MTTFDRIGGAPQLQYGKPLTPEESVDLAATPRVAGMYQVYLGEGKDASPAERALAGRVLASAPEVAEMAKANRRFLGRAVGYVLGQGVTQILDIGSGFPTTRNVHQVAQEIDARARVVYVDNDPRVSVHGRALLAGQGGTHFLRVDLRHPGEILHVVMAQKMLDFNEPVALFLVAILHFIPDDPCDIVRTLVSALPTGSLLVISHAIDHEALRPAADLYQQTPSAVVLRTAAEVRTFFAGTALVEPGLVRVDHWRPEPADEYGRAASMPVLAGVARKP